MSDSSDSTEDSEHSFEATFKRGFQACLEDLETTGTFTSFQTTPQFVNPGLHVEKVGSIGLPLSTRDAAAIAAARPIWQKDQTVIDESVRKTWELDSSEFSLTNPAWETYLQTLADQAYTTMGVQVATQAHKYKLLLYEKGAFFKPHRDTEKMPGMFGTLIICLPSLHTGGEVVLVHGQKTRTIETSKTSAFDLSALAWYSDVQHEIRPVTSGFRLVLTYNLVQVQSMRMPSLPSAAELDVHSKQLETYLRTWIKDFPRFDYWVSPLEHKYTPASLSLQNLKGQDAAKCQALQRLCSQNDVWWFLSMMTKRTQEDLDMGYDADEDEDYLSLDHTSTPAGNPIDLDLSKLEEDQILADVKAHWDREADSEDEGEFTGNESMPATQRYHDAVVVMVKKDFVISSVADRNTLSGVFELIKNDEHIRSEKRQSALKAILKGALEKMLRSDPSPYLYYARETGAATRAEYEKLFNAVSQHCYSTGQGNLIDEMLQALLLDDKWIHSKPLCDLIAQKVAQDVNGGSDSASHKWLTLPLPPVLTYTHVNGRRLFLESIKDALPDAAVPSFKQKMQRELDRLLDAANRFTDMDIQPLVRIIEIIPLSSYLELVLPKLDKLLSPTLVLQFLHSLLAAQMSEKDHQVEIERTTLKFFIPRLISESTLSFDNLAIGSVPPKPEYFYRPQSYQVPRASGALQLAPPATQLLDSVGRCMKQGLEDEAVKLLGAALPSPTTMTTQTIWKHGFMLIDELLKLLQLQQNTHLNQVATPFVSEVIQILARQLARTHPTQPPNWTPLSVSRTPCNCEPCRHVNQYLGDPKQIVGRFAYTQSIRKHLAKTFIRSGDLRFDTVTSGSPHTLVLQSKSKEYTHSVAVWEEEVQDMRSRLTALGNDFVTSLLGADIVSVSELDHAVQYAKAVPTTLVPTTAQCFPLSASLSSPNIQEPSSRAGTKRKHDQVEVIDLT